MNAAEAAPVAGAPGAGTDIGISTRVCALGTVLGRTPTCDTLFADLP